MLVFNGWGAQMVTEKTDQAVVRKAGILAVLLSSMCHFFEILVNPSAYLWCCLWDPDVCDLIMVHVGNAVPCQSSKDIASWVDGCGGWNHWGQHIMHLTPGQHGQGDGLGVVANTHEPAITPCPLEPGVDMGS